MNKQKIFEYISNAFLIVFVIFFLGGLIYGGVSIIIRIASSDRLWVLLCIVAFFVAIAIGILFLFICRALLGWVFKTTEISDKLSNIITLLKQQDKGNNE